jgi:biopolymer transport protein ExbB
MRRDAGLLRLSVLGLAACALFVGGAASTRPAAYAQPTSAPVPAATAPAGEDGQPADAEPGEEKSASRQAVESIGALMVKSGWVGIVFYAVLFLFSLLSLTVALERLLNQRRARILPHSFKRALHDVLLHRPDSADELRRLCETSDTPVSRILRAGALRAGRPIAEVEKAMEDAAGREVADMRGRNRLLYVLGNVGPLIGLLGTVVGMIFTFSTASKVGLGQGERLAEGIYLALLCTAGGLAIAIPALLVAALLNTRAERLMREVVECLTETIPFFLRLERMERTRPSLGDEPFGKTAADYSVSVGEADER